MAAELATRRSTRPDPRAGVTALSNKPHAASSPAGGDRRRPLRVALLNMPFLSTRYPSMPLGLLQAILRRRGIEAATHYLNLHFAARIGWEAYEALAVERCFLLGEWVFAREAFGDSAPDGRTSLAGFAEGLRRTCAELGCDASFFLALREQQAPAFVEECLETVPWERYDVAGFGSVFEQNCAALALARRIKERHPRIVTVFGGANFEDEMGLEFVRALPWIDYAVIGEGDEAFPALLERLAAGEEAPNLPGVARRGPDAAVVFGGRAPLVRDLDALPEPEYADYFATAADVKLPAQVRGQGVQVPFESARGCWWGQRHHCTFCGLNGLGMTYRSKSPARVLDEIDELAHRYNYYSFEAVDNILDQRYIGEVFGRLVERRHDYTFFYEVKANLKQEQLRTMARGGVRTIQPGVESLSTHVLKLMRKGTSAIQNVRLLKWAAYYGMGVTWNVLVGFPGEQPEDYAQQLATMQLVPHLPPPQGVTRILLERFSPYFNEREQFGIGNVRADGAYARVYPGSLNLDRIAYEFEYDIAGTLPEETHEPLRQYVHRWRAAWRAAQPPYLVYLRGAGRLTVMDGRQPEAPRAHVFDEGAALAYEFCGPTDHGAAQVLGHLRNDHGLEIDPAGVQGILNSFTALGLMIEEDGHYLSLALPSNPNW